MKHDRILIAVDLQRDFIDGALGTAEAVAIVLEKNCRAANLGLKKAAPSVPAISARTERSFYVKKYSKLKNSKGQEEEE